MEDADGDDNRNDDNYDDGCYNDNNDKKHKGVVWQDKCPFLLLYHGHQPARKACMVKYVRHNFKVQCEGTPGAPILTECKLSLCHVVI